MGIDYPVFDPLDEKLAQIICRILEKRGYDVGYQTSYPQHTIYVNVDNPQVAKELSQIIKNFMAKYKTEKEVRGRKITVYNYDEKIVELAKLIPETEKVKRDRMIKRILSRLDREFSA